MRTAASAAVGVAGLALVGCGDDDVDTVEPSTSQGSVEPDQAMEGPVDVGVDGASLLPEPVQAVTQPALDEASVSVGVLTGDELAAIDTVDLRRSISPVSERWLGQLVYSKLLRFQDVAAGELASDLAESLPEMPDAATLVFELHPSARWDARAPTDGRAVTAEDVRSTIVSQQDRLDPSFARHDRLLDLGVDVTGPSTIRISVRGGDARLPGLLASSWLEVLPGELLKDDLTEPEAQRGSGPFRLDDVDAGGWSFRANDAHHLGAPRVSELYVASRAASEQVAAFANGEQNVLERVAVDVARGVADPDDPVLVAGLAVVLHLFFQVQRPPWDDPRRRRAVHLALDRSALATAWFGEGAGPSGYVPPSLTGSALSASDLASLPGYPPSEADLREARALWDAAGGLPTPEPVALAVRAVDEQDFAPGATIVTQLREALGVEVEVQPLDDAELVAALVDGRLLWFLESAPSSPEPLDFIEPLVHSRGALNRFGFVDAEVDETIELLIATTNSETRKQQLLEFQRRLLDLVPTVPLVHPALATVVKPAVTGRRVDVLDNSWQWADVEVL